MQGHYANELSERVLFPYGIFCYENFTTYRENGETVFKFSNPNQIYNIGSTTFYGSGHIAIPSSTVNFDNNAKLYFAENECTIKTNCEPDETCIARISNPEQGHIADCNNNNMPFQNAFQNKICCKPTEYCQDDIDNTGDGNIDCASPQCHPSDDNLWVPQECTGNNQTSDDCVIGLNPINWAPIYNETCVNNVNNQAHYCSYGKNGNEFERGFCCPAGQIVKIHPLTGDYFCEEPTQCGVGGLPFYDCDVDHRTNQPNWLTRIFSSTTEEWCVSQLPNFYNPLTELNDRSMGCCFIAQHGHSGFYYHSDNVKIFGYE